MACVQLHVPDNKFNFVDLSFRVVTNTAITDEVSLRSLTQNEGMFAGIYRHVYSTRDLSKHNCTFCY